ncbi:tumor necrosis factor alpha-induced protein 2-like isoform X2 [Erpetoichthys calabaricus]|uniref:tumor necrosis factor alpha-induced protein 2-like isoform X2 n=1 Tax=Erpetoichthys calabaricus TaxID=27687 RepID=UPI002234E324|nr:tumor necrosis factor alpha-induced protein 2-like isoform X2 [Erpetoichthys calabaricus]
MLDDKTPVEPPPSLGTNLENVTNTTDTEDTSGEAAMASSPESPNKDSDHGKDADERNPGSPEKKNKSIKLLPFLRRKKGSKTKSNDRSSPPPVQTFEECLEQRRLSQASRLLIELEQTCYHDDGEETQKKRDEINQQYEQLMAIICKAARDAITCSSEDLVLLQSAVNAIEQEEKQDQRYLEESKRNPKIQGARPREWRKKHDKVLKETVESRMDDIEDMSSCEKFSSSVKKNIFKMGMRVKEDLISVVKNIKDCYPEEYDICNFYAQLYHTAFSSHIQRLVDFELDPEDCSYLLCWLNDYYPNDVLKHKDLEGHINSNLLGRLVQETTLYYLESTFLTNRQGDLKKWLSNALEICQSPWLSGEYPKEINGVYNSDLAIHVIQCMDTAAQTARQISEDILKKVMPIILEELEVFLVRYQTFMMVFINRKEKRENRTAVVLANMPCYQSFRNYINQQQFFEEDSKKKCLEVLSRLENIGCEYLLKIFYEALKPNYKGLVTPKWMDDSSLVNLLKNADKQMKEFKKMETTCFLDLVNRLHFSVIAEYIRRIMKKKIKLRNQKTQEQVANQICAESEQIHQLFTDYGSTENWLQPILPKVAEVLRLQEASSIQLEIATMVRDYPDIREHHVSALLEIKPNLSPEEVRNIKKVLRVSGQNNWESNRESRPFFSKVHVNSNLIARLTSVI